MTNRPTWGNPPANGSDVTGTVSADTDVNISIHALTDTGWG